MLIHLPNPLTAMDVYIRQIWLITQRIQNVFYIYRRVKNMEKFILFLFIVIFCL
jgi:hypothetical protein